MAITIGVVRETVPGERRVALTPDVAKKLKAKAVNLLIERGAGYAASFPDTCVQGRRSCCRRAQRARPRRCAADRAAADA